MKKFREGVPMWNRLEFGQPAPLMDQSWLYGLPKQLKGTNKAWEQIERLYHNAKCGDTDAAKLLGMLSIAVVARFEEVASESPEHFGDFFEHEWAMPFLWNPHPDRARGAKKRWEQLRVSSKNPVRVNKRTKWTPSDPKFKRATDLIDFVEECRTWSDGLTAGAPKWFHAAGKLPPLSAKTWPAWWKIAEQAFDANFPEPEKHPLLNALVTAESHRKSVKETRRRIKEALKIKVQTFVGAK